MPRELKVYEMVEGHVIGPVRLMSQQDNRFAWGNVSRSQGKVDLTFEDVIDTRYQSLFPLRSNGTQRLRKTEMLWAWRTSCSRTTRVLSGP
jgi:hypothetical protein